MPTKTDRILSYLPSTFRALPRPTALYSVADAFGAELQNAENSLAAVMQAHWVDHADRFEDLLVDLRKLAALYGLAPRDDEEVEEFREHLKRFVRTFIEGTVTVQGILRISAEALGLRIADAPDEIDAWWNRPDGTLTTTRARLDDAAVVVFGASSVRVAGSDARPAEVTGTDDLSAGVDVRAAPKLVLAVDGGDPVPVDLSGLPDPHGATAETIAQAVNAALGKPVAGDAGGRLRLASPTLGSASRLSVEDVDGDAAPLVLGLAARRAHGREARPATIVGTRDLSAGVDLDGARYVRVAVDGTRLAEVDLRGGGPAHVSLADLRGRLEAALGPGAVGAVDGRLSLTSPTAGAAGTIELLPPGAQDATGLVFGSAARFAAGEDEQPARIVGRRDVSGGLDLRDASSLEVGVDSADPVTVDCAGADPAATRPGEVVERLNAVLGPVAGYDGQRISLASLATGPDATIELGVPDERDATETILGIGLRSFAGADAVTARVEGPAAPVDLRAQSVVRISVDGLPARKIDLRAGAGSAGAVTPEELAAALEAAGLVAAVEGGRLVVTSPTPGAAGSIGVEPLEETVVRRFVSRAFVRDEAAEVLLGMLQAEAVGDPPRAAELVGTVDLSRGVDLRDTGWIAVAVDGDPPREIAVAGTRPRATTLEEVVSKINAMLGTPEKPVARAEGGRLALVSPTVGSGSRLALAAPTPEDALPAVGLGPGTYRGSDGARVSYLGTVDLGAGVALAAGAAVRLTVDGGPERQVPVAGVDPAHTTVDEIVTAINSAFSARVAIIEGPRIRLQSPSTGDASTLDFLPPAGAPDATAAVFGFEPPRSYRGADAEPARVVGTADLSGGLVLERRFLRVGVDAHAPVSVDLGARAADPAHASLDEVVSALGDALGAGVASHDGASRLVLTSPTAGAGSRLVLEPHASRDARSALLGNAPADDTGSEGQPATITGTVDLLGPVDLSRRSTLSIALDDGRLAEIDVAGATPQATFLDEVVAAIDARLPGIAEATDDDRLRLRWPGRRIAVLPTRVLEVVEYPPGRRVEPALRLRHGETWQIDDDGAAEAELEVELLALRGIAAPGIVNTELGLELRVLTTVDAGGRLRLGVADGGIEALVIAPSGVQTPVPADALLVEALEADADPADVLRLPRGRSEWRYLECVGTRFDRAHFDGDHWSGGPCTEVGVFDASRWRADRPVNPVFGDRDEAAPPSVEVTVRWTRQAPGAFAVNLPVDLPPRFGARFNDGRFGSGEDQVETYPGAVTEPAADPHNFVKLLSGSALVAAAHVDFVPLGWAPVTLPFRRPQRLTQGAPGVNAAMYLQEADVPGFIELTAREKGAQGNQIVVTAPRAWPAAFDVTVRFEAGRFESARAAVAGRPLSASADDLLRPGPIGVLEAKAAGIRAAVWRERTPPVQTDDHDE